MDFQNGGSVLRNDSSGFTDYAVTILDEKYYIQHPNQDCTLPLDTFSSLYIWDFIRARRNDLPLPSMRAYRLTNTKYESFDVNKILAQKIKWTDLVVKENIGSHSSQTAQEQVKRLKSRKIKQLFEDEVNAKEIIKEAEDIPKSLPMSPLSKRNLKRSSKTESSTEEKPEGEIVNPNQRNLDSQRDEGMELTLTPPPKKQKLTEKPKLEEALATGDGSSISSKLTEETSSSPPKRSETDKEQQKKKTNVQIRLSPHPSTSAQVRSRLPIKFVPRELAGPKSIKSKLPEKKPVKVASTTNEPIKTSKDTDTTVEDDGEQTILEDGDDKSTIVDSDIGDAQSQTSEESRSRYKARPFASRKTPYTDGDGQLILDLICDNRAFLYTRGNRLWQQMADSDVSISTFSVISIVIVQL